ncbi:MAG: FkbM family methyltransferase [Candidatus Pacebacteria bacterium]|nr:FkbM family methyltransferase [Candidatus Paceibacterota bacterium]
MKKLRDIVPQKHLFTFVKIKNFFTRGFCKHYYSQGGEDILISAIFGNKKDGFFVDVGAYHPKHYSNTQLLHEKGWSGINIDPNPDNMKSFRRGRKRDVNLQIGISKKSDTLTYYNFAHPCFNTFSKDVADEVLKKRWVKLLEKIQVPCYPLRDILAKHVPKNKKIDLLNVDVEGFDLQVLRSNDWKKFRPHVIIIEDHSFDPNDPTKAEIYTFLKERSYNIHAYTGMSLIFVDKTNV